MKSGPQARRSGSLSAEVARFCGLVLANPGVSVDELAEASGVARRTVFRRIKLMRSAGFVIRVDREKGGYVAGFGPRLLHGEKSESAQVSDDELVPDE